MELGHVSNSHRNLYFPIDGHPDHGRVFFPFGVYPTDMESITSPVMYADFSIGVTGSELVTNATKARPVLTLHPSKNLTSISIHTYLGMDIMM
jgi:hypothetical protein